MKACHGTSATSLDATGSSMVAGSALVITGRAAQGGLFHIFASASPGSRALHAWWRAARTFAIEGPGTGCAPHTRGIGSKAFRCGLSFIARSRGESALTRRARSRATQEVSARAITSRRQRGRRCALCASALQTLGVALNRVLGSTTRMVFASTTTRSGGCTASTRRSSSVSIVTRVAFARSAGESVCRVVACRSIIAMRRVWFAVCCVPSATAELACSAMTRCWWIAQRRTFAARDITCDALAGTITVLWSIRQVA